MFSKRRRPMIWLAGSIVGLLSVLDHAGAFGYRGPDRERYSGIEAVVTNAVDGDTFDVNLPDGQKPVTRIGLCGIDCPEITHNTGEDDAHFGREASDFVRRKVVSRRVRLELDPMRHPRDRNQRLLAYVYFVDTGEFLNEMLIDCGLAYADRRLDHVFKNRFISREKEAMKTKEGLWKEVQPELMPERRQRIDAAQSR